MTRIISILTLTFLTALSSFGQTETSFTKAERYKTNKFDVAIFPSNYLDLIGGQRFTPTRQEVDEAERVLQTELKTLNKELINQYRTPIIHKKLKKYKRQYFGYIDQNGDKILLINCFWPKHIDFSERWLKERIVVLDGGSYYWSVKFNLTQEELFELGVNGYA